MILRCKCTNGILYPEYMDRQTIAEGDVWITVHKETRSLKQNAYYWKCIEMISSYTGDTRNGVHEDCLKMFAPIISEVNTKTGEVKERRKRSKEMNKSEFAEYLDNIIKFFGESYQLSFPDHNDYK